MCDVVQGYAALGKEGFAAGAVPSRAGGGYELPGAAAFWPSRPFPDRAC